MPLVQLHPLVTLGATLLGAAAMIAWRLRETSRPVTLRGIVAPPLGMSAGLAMFAVPIARVPWAWAGAAFVLGATVFAIPVVRASRLVRRGDDILLERSRAFLWILLGLVAVRLALRSWVEHLTSPAQTGSLLFLLAFGMIVRWRVGLLLEHRRLTARWSSANVSSYRSATLRWRTSISGSIRAHTCRATSHCEKTAVKMSSLSSKVR